MGRDRQLPHALSRVHRKYGTPYVGMLVTTAISTGVGLVMRDQLDELANIVNFGALCGFLLLHISVLVKFGIKGRSPQWFVHWAVPLLGIVVVLAVLQGMSALAMTVGLLWLAGGVIYGLALHALRRDELHTGL
jgi:amino acid transporter